MDSGRQAVDSTSRLLKKLELTGLTLMGDEKKPWEQKPGDTSVEPPPVVTPEIPPETDPMARKGHSFNPYDSRASVTRTPAPPKSTAARRVTPPAAKKRGFFARLFGRR